MAAIIDFPSEASLWRRRPPSTANPTDEKGKILVFDGVRYSRDVREVFAEEFYAVGEDS